MNDVNPAFIQRYRQIFDKDPNSKIFAPLAEAYRKMNILDEALKVAEMGVKRHPHFASGLVAYAKVLMDLKNDSEAIKNLKMATQLAPESIIAHNLLADLCLKNRQPKEALKSFKMVLFLNPQDTRAQKAVKKLESLTADEYDADLFSMKPVTALKSDSLFSNTSPGISAEPIYKIRTLERYVSLADAFIVRNDLDKALQTLAKAKSEIGEHPEIKTRFEIISKRSSNLQSPAKTKEVLEATPIKPLMSRKEMALIQKRRVLEELLQRVNQKRFG